jgi:hypothetical protein
MSFDGDPYRILGLPRGASLAEVKRAYRLLAKQYHPDSAGERALPRFLAIQAAYEALVTGRPPSVRRPSRTSKPAWEADPGRARATRDAYRRRAGGASARPGTRPPDEGSDRPPGRRGQTPGGDGAAPEAAPGADPDRSRRRPGRKATLGSTSYDDARPPFDATWEGGTWYGASSGTYWTINPKEYADPRKHGPEYLARARRAWRRAAPGAARPSDEAPPDEAPPDQAAPDAAPPGVRAAGAAAPEHDGPGARSTSSPRPTGARRPAGLAAAVSAGPGDAPETSVGSRPIEHAGQPAGLTVGARAVLALLGWPPIGLAIVALLGQASGCGRFAASCGSDVVGAFGVATWLVQLAVVAILFALPWLARPAAAGSIALLATSIPAAVLLSAIGGARDPAGASVLLVALLAIAWTAGVAVELSGRFALLSGLGRRIR